MKKLLFIFFAFITLTSFAQNTTTAITPNGQKLIKLLDSTHLDRLWRKGYTIDWLTGVSIAKTSSTATHCSAFGAAFAYNLGIYLLRPPQHAQTLLANAQCIWLTDSCTKYGWKKVATALEAQNAADSGYLVVIGYQSPNANTSGHLAVVRPAVKTLTLLQAEGPQETQSGDTNAISISEKLGFSAHPLAFPNGVIYYRHNINWDSLTLPVTLKEFAATNEGNSIRVSWNTATELNASHFILQHSTDGSSYTDIATVNAIGMGANEYSFVDNNPTPSPLNGVVYYRLASVDKDGEVSYSKVVSCELLVVSKQLTVYPNPARDYVTISGNHIASVQVIDNRGRVVKIVSLHNATNPTLSVNNLPAGLYHLRIQTTDGKLSSIAIMVND